MSAYATLEKRFERLHLLRSATDLLDWDTATMMPTGSAEARGGQMAVLRVLQTELLQDPSTKALLDEAEAAPPEGAMAKKNLVAMRRTWIHGASLPVSLVEAHAKAVSASEMRWRSARKDSDFAAWAPHLAEMLRLTREIGEAKAAALGTSTYDALLDEFEPGGRSERLDRLFATLARDLPPLLDRVIERQTAWPNVEPRGPFALAAQQAFSRTLADTIGFDFTRGRIDTSTHPFCGGSSEDVRLTTRYDENDFLSSAMSVLHELGHAMYEQGLPRDWRAQPVGRAPSMAIHESQSLLIEMQASRRTDTVGFLHRAATEAFGDLACTPSDLLRSVRRASRGFIRVEADEVSYPLHVILRYRLERALLSGDLNPSDLPGAWADGMKELLGVVPPDDRRGCLQDIHWPSGAFGYFPTYTMGAIAASQIFAAALKSDPAITAGLGDGKFGALFAFLRPNVHALGASVTVDELLTKVTGSPLDEQVFLAHLRSRYLEDAALGSHAPFGGHAHACPPRRPRRRPRRRARGRPYGRRCPGPRRARAALGPRRRSGRRGPRPRRPARIVLAPHRRRGTPPPADRWRRGLPPRRRRPRTVGSPRHEERTPSRGARRDARSARRAAERASRRGHRRLLRQVPPRAGRASSARLLAATAHPPARPGARPSRAVAAAARAPRSRSERGRAGHGSGRSAPRRQLARLRRARVARRPARGRGRLVRGAARSFHRQGARGHPRRTATSLDGRRPRPARGPVARRLRASFPRDRRRAARGLPDAVAHVPRDQAAPRDPRDARRDRATGGLRVRRFLFEGVSTHPRNGTRSPSRGRARLSRGRRRT